MKKQLLGAIAAIALVGAGASGASAQTDNAVTILHGIPGITVDLRVDGELVIAGFNAGDTQDFTPLAGTVLKNIEAVRAGGDEVVIGPIDSFTVPDSGNTSVVVHLDNDGNPTITPFVNSAPPTDQGRGLLTVRHVADASPVSVAVGDENIVTEIGNGQEGGVVLPSGEVSDAWITAGGERIAAIPTLALKANTQLIVYVGGSLEANNLEFYLQQVAASGIESVPTPMAEADQVVEQADSDDGTPQPDVVNTGDAIDAASGNPVVLGAAIGLFALAALAVLARWRILVGANSASLRHMTPWGPPSVEALVRRSDSPFS